MRNGLSSGGFVSVDAGTAPDADTVQIPHDVGETALNFAACIGCGACVAACPNGSGNLYTGAKLAHLSLLPHGQQERERRAHSMGAQADAEFGHCTLFGECARVCPAEIPITAVAALNHEPDGPAAQLARDPVGAEPATHTPPPAK